MDSQRIQFIIVIIILVAIAAWIIYKLVSTKHSDSPRCTGCGLAETCSKRKFVEKSTSVNEVPECKTEKNQIKNS